jgi:membrane-bound lytic murein transglycosylase D
MSGSILLILLALSIFSCSGWKNVKMTENDITLPSIEKVMNPLDSAKIYIELAKTAEIEKDSSIAERYFERAMEISVDFQTENPETLDSLSKSVIEEISIEYSKYLARINGLEEDSLTAANVIELIGDIEESVSEDSSETFVTINDVIDTTQQLSIPLVLNKKVKNAIEYFQGRGRRVFTKWLQRSGWFRDLMIPLLQEEGVPEELYYLAMIESGFNPHARSYARATGIWQFMQSTGKAYGLNNSWWYDERRDPEKSTRAAAQHLKDLYERFNNWYLAIAGYNFSPAKIESRMKRYNVQEFWDLPRLPRQTRNYVPTFIAAVLIAKNPENYSFYIEPEKPIVYDTVTVKECVDLNVVAECVGSTFSELKKLNPALLRWCTPPDKNSWILNIPIGTKQSFLENYEKVPDNTKFTYVQHRIRRGETLSEISRKYGVSLPEIKRFNNIRGTLIREGHYLVIPYPQNKQYARELAVASSRTYSSTRKQKEPVKNVPGREKFVHVVSQGESLWDIALFYGVSISDIRYWNGLTSSRLIYPEQELHIWIPQNNNSTNNTREVYANASRSNQVESDTSAQGKTIIYTVRNGDTLWDIANRHGVSIRDLKNWNNRTSNLIKPGDELKILTYE